MPNTDLHDNSWASRYGHICPNEKGHIISIEGIGNKDYYNPTLCVHNDATTLAFRCEARKSAIETPETYHPTVAFAQYISDDTWRLIESIPPFDMCEDPSFLVVKQNDQESEVIFGNVRVEITRDGFIPNTQLYRGTSLKTLNRKAFTTVHGMKDVRLIQLPDRRFLICRRPTGGNDHQGRIHLQMIENLSALSADTASPTLAVLDSGHPDDWVGANNIYLLNDEQGVEWIGILGHLGLAREDGSKHYAATTYKIKLQDVLGNQIHNIMPRIIATRACFTEGPYKNAQLADVVFPGNLETLGGKQYRLWAGLSDARIGTLIVDDPFGLYES